MSRCHSGSAAQAGTGNRLRLQLRRGGVATAGKQPQLRTASRAGTGARSGMPLLIPMSGLRVSMDGSAKGSSPTSTHIQTPEKRLPLSVVCGFCRYREKMVLLEMDLMLTQKTKGWNRVKREEHGIK